MDRSDIIFLIAETREQDANGVWRTSTTEHMVYARVDSISRAEFYEAGRNGLNPSYEFTIFFGDYNGERMVRYKDDTYAIYRTYRAKTDVLELYAERKGGTNG